MEKFTYNNTDVRFFSSEGSIYFVTADANQAFGFSGENTPLDRLSVRFDSLSNHANCMVTKDTSVANSSGDANSIPTNAVLNKTQLVISFSDLIRAIVRSNKPELADLANSFLQMAESGFRTSHQNTDSDRKSLPPVSDYDRIEKLAQASKRHDSEVPQDKIKLPGWLTIREMLVELGEDPSDEAELINDAHFRFWINRQIADIYRAQYAEEPPAISRKHGKGYCYPPSFKGLVTLYRQNWLENG